MTDQLDQIETTTDGFLNNGFHIVQPAKGGHRSGLDAILLAATVPQSFNGKLADFGAGSGAVGLAVAHRCKHANVTLVESDTQMIHLAKRSKQLSENSHLFDLLNIIHADVTSRGQARIDAGLGDGLFDRIVTNPPYNNSTHRPSPNTLREKAHMLGDEGFEPWVRTAAATCKSGGELTLIIRPSDLQDLLNTFNGRFGSCRIIPVHPKSFTPANRLLVGAKKAGRAELQILPGLVIHKDDGRFSDDADAIFRGESAILL